MAREQTTAAGEGEPREGDRRVRAGGCDPE